VSTVLAEGVLVLLPTAPTTTTTTMMMSRLTPAPPPDFLLSVDGKESEEGE